MRADLERRRPAPPPVSWRERGRGHDPAPLAISKGLWRAGGATYRLATKGKRERLAEEEETRRHTELIAAIRSGPAAPGAALVPRPGAALAARPAAVSVTVVDEPDDESGHSWRFRNRRWLRTYYVTGLLLLFRLVAHFWALGALVGFAALAALAVWWFLSVAPQWRYARTIDEQSGITVGRRTITGPAPRFLLRAGTWWTPRNGVLAAVLAVLAWLCIPLSVPVLSWAVLLATGAAVIRWHRFRIRRVEAVDPVDEDDNTLTGRWAVRIWPIGTGALVGGSCIDEDTFHHDQLTDTTTADILLRDDVHARQVMAQRQQIQQLLERRLKLDMDTVRLKLAGDPKSYSRPADRVRLIIAMGHHMLEHAVAWPGAEVYERDGCYYAPIGEEEDGTVVELLLADKDGVKHVLIVGNTGAGKTGTGNVVLLAVARIACVIYLDGKQGDSAPHLTDAMWARCVTPEQQRAAIAWLYAVMKDRQYRRGRDRTGGRWRTGLEPEPAYALYLEEAAGVRRNIEGWRDPATGLLLEDELLEMGEQSRALGLHLIFAQHNPSAVRTPGGKDMRGFLRGGGNAILLRQLDDTTARLAAEGCPENVPEMLENLPEQVGWAVNVRHALKVISGKYRHRYATDDAAEDEARTLRASDLLIRPAQVNIDANPEAYEQMMADPYAPVAAGELDDDRPEPAQADLDRLNDGHRLALAALYAAEAGRLPVLDDDGRPTAARQPAAELIALTPLENACADSDVVNAWLGRDDLTVSRRTLSKLLNELRDWGLADKERVRAHYWWRLTSTGREFLLGQGPAAPAGDPPTGVAGSCLPEAAGCGALLGEHHRDGCAIAQCLTCGLFLDDCKHHDGGGATWEGLWPGEAELMAAGYAIRQASEGQWEPCDPGEPGAVPDYDQLERFGTWDREARRWRIATAHTEEITDGAPA